ncbi:MAG: hypothetical protein ACRDKF_17765 [Actinomycetota bacterium]
MPAREMNIKGRHLGAERVPDDRGRRPRWDHSMPAPGSYGRFVVDRMTDEQMQGLAVGDYFGSLVDYRRQFPAMANITRVYERMDDGSLHLWMTDGPQEVSMMRGLTRHQKGHVLVTGLGLGIVQQLLLSADAVTDVTTIEPQEDVPLLHESNEWWGNPRHRFLEGSAAVELPELVSSGNYDGYVLDHWATLGDNLDEKVSFLRLLDDVDQGDRPVSMWGFWWEVQETESSESPDTRKLLAETERCTNCGMILGDAETDGTESNFWVARAKLLAGLCAQCEDLQP